MKRSAHRLLIPSMVAAALAPAACGGSTASSTTTTSSDAGADGGVADAAPTLRPGFTPITCDANGGIALSALTATPPFDYAELRRQDGYNRGTPAKPDDVIEKVGTLCKTATDVATCKSAFAAIEQPDKNLVCSVPYPCGHIYLATTRGDQVKALLSPEDDLGPIAAPIDTPEEAAFVVWWSRELGCATASAKATSDGFDVAYTYDTDFCTSGKSEHHDVLVHVAKSGAVTTVSDDVTPLPKDPNVGCAAARRALDVAYEGAPVTDAGDWLARAAHLEAASVGSFARLARELAAHGAPEDLVRRAARAARDERRHAQAMRSLARAAGKRVSPAPRVPRVVRSLEAVALENAVEGATRETWGAVVARHQAMRAEAPALRAAFDVIADDEASHAELASDVADWLSAHLDAPAAARVRAARDAAVAALARDADREIPEALRKPLGLPTRDVTVGLLEAARRELFA